VPGRSGVTRRECSDHRVTVNLNRPSAARDGSESMCLVRARHHLEASGFCRGPGNSGSDGDIRRRLRCRADRLPVPCNLARRHNFREVQCPRWRDKWLLLPQRKLRVISPGPGVGGCRGCKMPCFKREQGTPKLSDESPRFGGKVEKQQGRGWRRKLDVGSSMTRGEGQGSGKVYRGE
jgi:hypothetical protein